MDEKRGETNADLLSTVSVQGWKQYRREYIAAMEKEQTMMTAMFGLVGLTTVFIVFVIFYMIVSHKSKDIGILKSLGVSAWNLTSLFLLFSFLLGLIGSAVGVASGWVFLRYINRIEGWLFEHFGFQLWDRTMYAIGDIPHEVRTGTIAVIVVCAILACLAGAVMPSRRAAKAAPAEALQVSQI
jgi:lipoprotein-releasing system permease protein